MDYYKDQTYYDVLGVPRDASFYSIEKAKDRLKFGSQEDQVPFSMWGKIDEAYYVLSDPDRRREYDRKLDLKDKETLENTEVISTIKENDESLDDTKVEESAEISIKDVPDDTKNESKDEVIEEKIDEAEQDYTVNFTPNQDTNVFSETMKILDDEVNKLLSEPHNSYKLAISRMRYQKQIELHEKELDVLLNSKNKVSKLKINAAKKRIESAKKNLASIDNKIAGYNKTQKLTNLNQKLIEASKELLKHSDDKPKIRIKFEKNFKKALRKRDKNARKVKIKLMNSRNFVKAYQFVRKINELSVAEEDTSVSRKVY